MLRIRDLSYSHPNRDPLFQNLSLNIQNGEKLAIIGANGGGKSTLLAITAGLLKPPAGTVERDAEPWLVPQHFGQFNHLTAAEALGVSRKLGALQDILAGRIIEDAITILADDWNIEERCTAALHHWGIGKVSLSQPLATLSGGQKTRLFLAGIDIHRPRLVLLDEPTNHLDRPGRGALYDFVQSTTATLMVVSHDRGLLRLLPAMYELHKGALTAYGGSYDFFVAQRQAGQSAQAQALQSKQAALRKAKVAARQSLERQQKLDARGRKKQDKAGIATIMRNTLRNKAEKSTARNAEVHEAKIGAMRQELIAMRQAIPNNEKMRLGMDNATLHEGKLLVRAEGINAMVDGRTLWPESLDMELYSGTRLRIEGANGSGKTTLLRLLLGQQQPSVGAIYIGPSKFVSVDQEYSLIREEPSVLEQASAFNEAHLEAHELKSRLTHYLFTSESWHKPCAVLSGGERMRLMLCCLSLAAAPPDLIVLDEPTNNLDLENVEILTSAIRGYEGTLIAVSHDEDFLEAIGIDETIRL